MKRSNLKVNRKIVKLKKMTKENDWEDNFVDASPAQRVSMVWELTAEVWSLKDKSIAQRRLQRHITRLIKK